MCARQAGFAAALEQSVRELERKSGGAEFAERGSRPRVELRVDERGGCRRRRRNLVMIQHHDIHSAFTQPLN